MSEKKDVERRTNVHGQYLCTARNKAGEPCGHIAAKGQRVCRLHGGSSPQALNKARIRLAALVDPAIATLAREMTQAEKSADKQRAANSILDRAGFGRVSKVETSDARELLIQKLIEIRDSSGVQQTEVIEQHREVLMSGEDEHEQRD